jgi:hypothetical protein
MPQFLAPLDMTQVETQNFVLHNLAAEPGTPVPGQMYYDTVEEVVKFAINGDDRRLRRAGRLALTRRACRRSS